MATKVSGGSKASKTATAVVGSNGAATVTAKVKPLPAKVVRAVAALGEQYRFEALGFIAASEPVTISELTGALGGRAEAATLAVTWLKQKGWLTSERVPKASGGGWRYRLSDAGRERLTALGG
jgi:chromosome segregation and condensation protein ScpB